MHGEGLLEGTGAFPTSGRAFVGSQRAEGKVCLERKKSPEMGF
ncbi:hypothetical protein VO64_2981 [Pseudomonas synxantha]|uniref:Uncharacterized protein n=1 Tax=Pseudomonas synxantha TaxID=47883 RepID=A0AAU8TZC0_9PSED|nr:hypothetical protein VO64_2981 [Pseudomonas synxantha]